MKLIDLKPGTPVLVDGVEYVYLKRGSLNVGVLQLGTIRRWVIGNVSKDARGNWTLSPRVRGDHEDPPLDTPAQRALDLRRQKRLDQACSTGILVSQTYEEIVREEHEDMRARWHLQRVLALQGGVPGAGQNLCQKTLASVSIREEQSIDEPQAAKGREAVCITMAPSPRDRICRVP